MAQMRASVQSATRWSLILIVIFIVELTLFLFWAYGKVESATSPDNVADMVEKQVQAAWPEAKEKIRESVHKNAPIVADELSQSLIVSAGDLREYVERLLERQMTWALDESADLSVDTFESWVADNPQVVRRWVDTLEEAPENIDDITDEVDAVMEEQFGVQLQTVASQAVDGWEAFNERFTRVANSGAALDTRELIEQRLLRILKTLAVKYEIAVTESTEPE
jgi:hypothetical protein